MFRLIQLIKVQTTPFQLLKNTQLKTTRLKLSALFFVLFSAILFSSQTFAAKDAVLTQAEALIRKGDFKAAYLLLEPLEDTRAGDINYDYLFGFAGVESGNVTRGAFALERVLAVDPNNKDARTEMAKAHFLLGERQASKAEFNNVLALNPDQQTKKTIDSLLTAIQKIEGTTTTFGAYAEFGLGADSNISSAPNINAISVPLFSGVAFALGEDGREQSSNFMQLATGLSFREPVNDDFAYFGAVNLTHRDNETTSIFNTSNLDLNLGLQYRVDENNFSFALQNNNFYLDSSSFRHAYGATAQWLYNIDSLNQAGVFGQYSKISYAGNSIRNAQRSIGGVNVGHVFQNDYRPVVFASVYGGREDADDSSVNFLSQSIVGVRVGGQLNIGTRLQLTTSLGVENRKNDENDPSFLTKRKDNQYDATLGLRYTFARDWSIRPQYSYTKNDSNIDLNTFERQIFSISIRKDFNW
ncbi:MAG: hypothetical protein BVN34_04710 [Proteobacteria bacterium ST_bin12]|nr:MAG: hypothetical protein BVN34_04710 [Proteobacteria bacterium ST_bin12]